MSDKKELITLLIDEIDRADGGDTKENTTDIEKAYDYYYNRPRSDDEPGISDIQSSDVNDMVNAVLSQMAPCFAGDTIVEFAPMGEDDEPQAQLESDVVSDCVIHKNRGYTLFMGAIKNALLLRNAYIRVDVEEGQRVEVKNAAGISQEEILALLEQDNWDIDGDQVKITHDYRRIRLVNVEKARVRTTSDWDSPFLEGVPFFAEQQLLTRSQLVELGADKKTVYDLKPYTAHDTTSNNAARQATDNDLTREEESQELINTFVCFAQLDRDNDGIAELHRIHLAYDDKEILFDEPAPFLPYASGSPFLTPNRHEGESLADHLYSIQDSKTHFMRQWHENAKRANKAGTIAAKGANIQDLMNPRSNGIYREAAPGLIRERTFTDVGPSMQMALDYLDKVRTERGGSSLDMLTGESQLFAKSVGDAGVERQYSSKEQLAGMMTKTLAETLISTVYRLVHQTYREYFAGEPISARINGKWTETDPGQWPFREELVVKPGMSVGERNRKDGALRTVIQEQKELMMAGYDGILTDATKYHNAVMDWLRSAELDAPEQYFISPDSPEAQQAMQQKQMAEQQQQQQIEQLQQDLQRSEAAQKAAELMLDYFKELVKMEIEEAKIVGSAANLQEVQDDASRKAGTN